MSPFKKIALGIILLGLLGMGFFAAYVYRVVIQPNTAFSESEKIFFIATGEDYFSVEQRLTSLLKNPSTFRTLAERKKYNQFVKPGRFILETGMNNNDIINTLRSGNTPITLSFNNQETIYDLAGLVSKFIEADSTALIKAILDDEWLTEQHLNTDNVLSLFIPNSYEFFWNTSANEFLRRMEKEHRRFWNDKRQAQAEQLSLAPAEVYTLASIVQKETTKADEMPRVAGVYINRLQNGWKLQADPTVIFSIKKHTGDFNQIIKRVLYKDLELDSPYNTYKHEGLPPGPITMPDIAAIDAVLNFENHNFFYFVADTQRPGYHIFAQNLSQHNRNRLEYQRWINKKGIYR